MDVSSEPEPKRIERVVLACVQCRGRHVKCDATQPTCNRCQRDGKECNYRKSRRGGLDKAALARRRLLLQQEAERVQQSKSQGQSQINQAFALENGHQRCTDSSPMDEQSISDCLTDSPGLDSIQSFEAPFAISSPIFQVNTDRLLELYFENFWPSFPFVLPLRYLQQRRMSANHGMEELLLVLQYIGSIYAPWTPSEPYLAAALQALSSPILAHTPFTVQALLLLAIAQYHSNLKQEGRARLSLAISVALELGMNQRNFPQTYGEATPVLEESWRRTYYMLNITDQHFAIASNSPIYTLAIIPNMVDLPCDDEYYESGQIPQIVTWHQYDNREFAEIEVVYSSIVYLYDMFRIVSKVMDMFLESGTFGEAIVEFFDTKLAIWTSLLPTSKKDPLRRDGTIDEIMFVAHMIAVVTINALHRPLSSLSLCAEELNTQAFLCPTRFTLLPKQGRGSHTARVLKAMEMHTKLLAIPCTIERHSVFAMCISAQLATPQISACKNFLEDHAVSIARDRIRLSIGFLNAMGSFWPLGKMMAKEVRHIARTQLSDNQSSLTTNSGLMDEIELPRDDLIWPVDPSTQIDIYSGLMLPVDWDIMNNGCSTSVYSGIP